MSTALAFDPAFEPVPRFDGVRRPLLPDPTPGTAARPASSPATFRLSRPKLVVAAALVAGVGCVLAAQLVLSIQTADGAFALQRLQATSTGLSRQVEVRTERLEVLAAPQHLAARATALGLVASGTPSVLRLSDGRVVGGHGAAPLPSGTSTVPVADSLLSR